MSGSPSGPSSETSVPRAPVSRVALDRLSERVDGGVYVAGDPEYRDACTLYNAAVTHWPAVVVRVASSSDVTEVLRFARDRGLEISVRGGGHGVAGQATAGDVVVDLAGLRGVTVDPEVGVLTAGGGATWGEVDTAGQEYGLATPGGRVTTTGIAGLTLGGGQGWLSPLYGLSADNLMAAEVVLADGRHVTATAATEPDLFWALCGGGGGFGVVTSFTYRLHPVGQMVLGGFVLHPLDRLPEVAAAYEEFLTRAPREVGSALVLATAPDAPFVPPELVGAPVVGLVLCAFGLGIAGAERVLAPMRDLGPPVVDLCRPMPYTELQGMTDEMNLPGHRNYWSAGYLQALDGVATPLADAIETARSPLSSIVLAPMGAAVNEVPPDVTAFAHRRARWLLHPLAAWTDPARDAVEQAWVGALMDRIRPHADEGAYLNLLSDQGSASVRHAYGSAYGRLGQVKQAYDPENVFRHAPPVALD